MKTYWDFSEKERSEMTEKDVEQYLDFHLMEKGVLKIVAPKLRSIEPEPELKKITTFEVGDVHFSTAWKAQKFLELEPFRENYEYSLGYDYKFPAPINKEIKQIDLYDRQSVMDAKTVLAKNKSAKEENDKAEREFAENSKKMRSCLDEVWNDYYRCQNLAAKHKKVLETKAEYLCLAEGNEQVAKGFLVKVYCQEDITEAEAFFN